MAKRSKRTRKLSVYSNLNHRRRVRKDSSARARAEYLASLPKHPVKRFFYRLHPKRVAAFWFSKRGAITFLKIIGVAVLLVILAIGASFAVFRQDLDAIRPGEIAKRVQTTVTTYTDRNGKILWEDKGDGNYKLVVGENDISPVMKQATIAIEDKDFYNHGGVSFSAIFRSLVNNLNGGDIQGGSTLTQQLVKQVFFADEAGKRGLDGVPRKVKEMILAVEVEHMYDKDKILNLYLNESPYGGRRNGVESAAQTYFGKPAKDLTLPEAALLAAIPNQPGLYDPYNIAGHEALIARQHKVLDKMHEQKYITQAQADNAKKFPILDHIKPLSDQYQDIKAPHFVQMVRSQLEQELGKSTVGRGGLTVKTTLDLRVQQKLEQSMNDMFSSYIPDYAGFTNGAATVADTQSGQIIAMMGSRDFKYPGFGQDNAATAYIQPGSTIKPLVYSQLFSNQGAGKQNFGSGSILADDMSMNAIYGGQLKNADGRYLGNITIRKALALSRNVPAVKAMYIAGVEPTRQTIHALGDKSYCTQGSDNQAGLASAIGGCTNRQIDLVTAYASLARMGVYKPYSTVLEVKNTEGDVLKRFKDEGKQVIDPQVAYILADILSDDNARAGLYGRQLYGLYIPGVRTAAKTGTSDKGGQPKDIWTMSYSPAVTMGVWLGNPDTRILTNGNSSLPARIVGPVMEYVHKDIYQPLGKWQPNAWYQQPAGIKVINGELYPSWYDKKQAQTNETMVFDKVSRKKATDCTPEAAKIKIAVVKSKDPITKKDIYLVADGYDPTKNDDYHLCSDSKPMIGSLDYDEKAGTLTVSVVRGTHPLKSLEISVNGQALTTRPVSSSGDYTVSYKLSGNSTVDFTANVIDEGYYNGSKSIRYTPEQPKTTGPGGTNDGTGPPNP